MSLPASAIPSPHPDATVWHFNPPANTNEGEANVALIEVGAEAPAFSLANQDGTAVSLAQHAGKYVLVWWYPKADTPG